MRLFLRYIVILLGSFFLLGSSLFAEDRCNTNTTNDITCPQFKIDLGKIDPVGWDRKIDSGTESAKSLLQNVAGLLLFIIPIIAWVSMIIAWYFYILSSGDSEKASQAKTIIKWNLVAILVALFSYAIIQLAAGFLSGSLI